MEHGKKKRKFGRTNKQRSALMKSLAIALIERGRVKTTEAKAKSLRMYIEHLVTVAHKHEKTPVATLRLLSGRLTEASGRKLVEIAPKFNERKGGTVRMHPLSRRVSDGARMAIIEFIA